LEESLLSELKRYVGWSPDDEAALRRMHPLLQPRFPAVIEVFYDRILEHQQARAALVGGESQVGHLKVQLAAWLEQLFLGPWDEGYYEQRARIGRMHVRIALPQHYMFAAMNVLRRGLDSALAEHEAASAEDQATARRALGRILDLELAIMLHTYREDLLAQRSRIERLATFGQMAASIGHELRNPLGVIESSLFLLRGRVQSDDRATKQVDRIGQQVEIASGIITGLLGLIRDKPLVREPLQIDRLMEDALALVTRAPEVQILSSGLSGFPPLHGDPAQLRQVFVNLIDNAVQAATPVGAQVQIAAVVEGTSLAISVEDGGPGVSPEIGARLFEPLITSKPNGTGLGLSFALRIVERHHGTLSYEPRERGARFVVRLPLEA
jgi:two-component system sensor histidine kinase HydH